MSENERPKVFREIEGTSGLERENYNSENGDVTHLAILVRVYGSTADEAVGRSRIVAKLVSDLIDVIEDVVWVPTEGEAAYALIQNAATALAALPASERIVVLAQAPALGELRELLTPPSG